MMKKMAPHKKGGFENINKFNYQEKNVTNYMDDPTQ